MDQVKREREIRNTRTRERSIEEMIQREKVLETILRIRQAPNLDFLSDRKVTSNE